MIIKSGDVICKYTFTGSGLTVEEGIVDDSSRMYINFNNKKEPVRFPGHRNVGRVWKDGKTLWLIERDDDKAQELFVQHYVQLTEDLERQATEAKETAALIQESTVKTVSRCFSEACNEVKPVRTLIDKFERKRRVEGENWDTSEYTTPERYSQRKIDMLINEMYISLTDEDILHLKTLNSQAAIDAAVRAIINKYWSDI